MSQILIWIYLKILMIYPSSGKTMSGDSQLRTYLREESVVFLKTKEQWGGLSNMAGGYPLCINGVKIRTAEALYQACRFPHDPDIQERILGQASPMRAKMTSKPYRKDHTRGDWDRVRVKVMGWCLRVKLAQNWEKFGQVLRETSDRPIVEESRRDAYWGAKPVDANTLQGVNALGRLLMDLRRKLNSPDADRLRVVDPLTIPDFLLLGKPIARVEPLPDTTKHEKEIPVPRQLGWVMPFPSFDDRIED